MALQERIARQARSFEAPAAWNAAAAHPKRAKHLHSSLVSFRARQIMSGFPLGRYSSASLRTSPRSARLRG